jgi:DNA repair photolyase
MRASYAYCFARPTHTYLDFNAREDFEREIVVKVNVPERLRRELAKPSWAGDHVALGTNTDPYQWVEGRYRLMRGIWAAMRDYANPCSVLTKSPLLTRDLDLMLEVREVTDFTAALSIPTLEESAWRATEPHTPHPRKRIEAVRKLTEAGIPTGVLIGPMIPGVNDHPDHVRELVDLCAGAGATHVTPIPLHLRGEVKDIWFDWLEQHHPEMLARYHELYGRGAYMDKEESQRLVALVKPRLKPQSAGRRPRWRRGTRTGHPVGGRNEQGAAAEPEQPALF